MQDRASSALYFGLNTLLRAEAPIHIRLWRSPNDYYPQTQDRASSALYSDLNTLLRAEGPIHTTLAQRARYTSDNAPEG